MAKRYATPLDHLMEYVSPCPNTGCWLWTGRINHLGYAQLSMYDRDAYRQRGRASVSVAAHRFAYELLVGPIPEGLEIDHLCRVRCCVNPLHLEPVSHGENIRRGIAGIVNGARERAKTHCPHGHEYTPDNTYITPRGSRRCLTCSRYHDRARFILFGRRASHGFKPSDTAEENASLITVLAESSAGLING